MVDKSRFNWSQVLGILSGGLLWFLAGIPALGAEQQPGSQGVM